CRIATVLQQLGKRFAGDLQRRRCTANDVINEVPLLISAVDEARACRTAENSVRIKVGQPDAVAAKTVDVWSLHVGSAVAAEIGVSHIVAHDENNVRPRRSGGLRLYPRESSRADRAERQDEDHFAHESA